jgi:cytochrome c oxidase assembly factor CtaG
MSHGPTAWALDPGALSATAGLPLAMRPEVCVPILAMACSFAVGWWRLRRKAPDSVRVSQFIWHAAAVAALGAALASPIARWAENSFLAHMVQHLLLIKVAAPALLLADPLAPTLWALPRSIRSRAGHVLARGRPIRAAWWGLTRPPLAWALYVVALWIWHVPAAWEAAVGDRLVHGAEHIAFFGTAILFWWPLIRPAPRSLRRLSDGGRVVYLVLAAFQESVLGVLLTVAPAALYPSYALEDQIRGGIAMWAAGGAVDMAAALALLWLALGRAGRAPQPVEALARAVPRT